MVQPGEVSLGKYRIDQVIGQGGMGIIVKAHHLHLDEAVAIKFLRRDLIDRERVFKRFLREAQAAARLKGEHVCQVFDVGQIDDGTPYMVMEFLDGSDLSHQLRRDGPAAPTVAVDHLLQACEAMAEAHALGIIHRDIKPGNFFITRRADGSPLLKVLDFGVSKAQFANDQQLTNTQAVMGTPTYMSPEQLRSSKYVDVRSDIWSMGVTLYHLLAGRPPFTGVNLSAMCLAIATEAPRPLTAPLPTGLDDVVMRCIAKEPAQRYQDVAELAAALAPYASAPQRAALTVERCRRILAKADPVAGVAVYNSAGMDALLAEDDDGTTAMIDGTTAVLDREDISDLAEPDRPDEPNEPDAQAQHAPPARWATVLAIALIAAVSLAVLLILYMVGGGESEPAAEQEPAAAKQPGSGALPSVDDGVDAADAANAADEIDERYSLTPSAEERSGKHNGQPVSETATDTNQPAVPAPVRPEQPGAEVDTGTARPAPRTGRERRSGRDARKRRSESAAPRPADNATPAASSEGTPDDTGDGLKLDSRH